jgi:hypothetical protein
MTEILTESFCERCGTRYTFESTAPKRGRIGKVRTLSKGLKNFVMSDDTTLQEAMADARSDDSQSVSAEQLDAFHKTFNFCMSCRQYTCSNCWNEVDGRCLSCAPHLGHEILPAPFPDLDPAGGFAMGIAAAVEAEPETNGHATEDLAWPEIDLPSARIARAIGDEVNGAEPEAISETVQLIGDTEAANGIPQVELQPDAMDAFVAAVESASEPLLEMPAAQAEAIAPVADELADAAVAAEAIDTVPVAAEAESVAGEAEPVVDAEAEPVVDAEAEPVVDAEADLPPAIRPRIVPRSAAAIPSSGTQNVDRVAAAAAQTNALLAKFRPGQSLDEAIAAYEAEVAKARGVEPGSIDLPKPAPRPAAAPPVAATPAPVPVDERPVEPIAAAPEPEAVVPAPVAVEPETQPKPVAAVAPEPHPVVERPVEPEPELVAVPEPVAASAPEPEPVAVEPEPEPVMEPIVEAPPPAPEPVAAAPDVAPAEPRRDIVEQPAWRIVAPDPAPEVPAPSVAPQAPQVPPVTNGNGQPQWPAAAASGDPQWPAQSYIPGRPAPAVGTLGGRTIVRPDDAIWAASNQEVLAKPPVTGGVIAPCRNCGLSLSASARFCRRCGTRQA